ncbi:hypothetical protein [Hwanghaeella sp. LZ110]|uniref:hypothetical protein n=1 Tax=Hwanghaeella sp. LZ110 TaxID=3402810 RepID=UPI003B673A10
MEPGESFSSWFSRLALGNGLTPRELYRIALPGARCIAAIWIAPPPMCSSPIWQSGPV